jgi:hypothetical protein
VPVDSAGTAASGFSGVTRHAPAGGTRSPPHAPAPGPAKQVGLAGGRHRAGHGGGADRRPADGRAGPGPAGRRRGGAGRRGVGAAAARAGAGGPALLLRPAAPGPPRTQHAAPLHLRPLALRRPVPGLPTPVPPRAAADGAIRVADHAPPRRGGPLRRRLHRRHPGPAGPCGRGLHAGLPGGGRRRGARPADARAAVHHAPGGPGDRPGQAVQPAHPPGWDPLGRPADPLFAAPVGRGGLFGAPGGLRRHRAHPAQRRQRQHHVLGAVPHQADGRTQQFRARLQRRHRLLARAGVLCLLAARVPSDPGAATGSRPAPPSVLRLGGRPGTGSRTGGGKPVGAWARPGGRPAA